MKRILSTTLVLGLLYSFSAQAYILPAEFIAKMLADKQRKVKVKDWSLKLSTEFPQKNEVLEERLYLKRPERMRRVQTDGAETITVQVERQLALGNSEGVQPSNQIITNLLDQIMLPKGKTLDARSKRMMESLEKVGIDTTQVAFGRHGKVPVYIVGAKSYEPNKPQIWFDKTSFLPIKWLVYSNGGESGDKIEFILQDYESSPAKSIYPQLVEVSINGELHSRSKLVEAKMDQSLPESLFQLR